MKVLTLGECVFSAVVSMSISIAVACFVGGGSVRVGAGLLSFGLSLLFVGAVGKCNELKGRQR